MASRRVLSRQEAEAVYDRIGKWQDTQAFYERPALDELLRHGEFERADRIFEVGCGTGRLAERLLRDWCSPEVQYEGVDLSGEMVTIARARLAPFGNRATVRKTDGALTFDRADGSQDRIVAAYVLDLLSEADARTFLSEAHRLLGDEGRLCVASLTWGTGILSGIVARLWDTAHAFRPAWVGGCRPLRMQRLLDASRWRGQHHAVVTAWGVPSEVWVGTPT